MYAEIRKKAIFGYEYRYDNKGNVLKKILPGSEFVQYWYDKADRLIYMRDQNLRDRKIYRFMLYDKFNRLVVQGTCKSCKTGISNIPVTVEFAPKGRNFHSTGYAICRPDIITDENAVIELVNYYDDYRFLSGPQENNFKFSNGKQLSSKGLQTGSIVRTSDGKYLYSVMYYDSKGLLVKSDSKYPDASIESMNNEYTFTKQVSKSVYELKKEGNSIAQIVSENNYNAYNNKVDYTNLYVTLPNKSAHRRLLSYEYDELGRVKNINRSGSGGAVSYEYDLHGWTTDIKGRYFHEQLSYADNNGLSTPCYNGNISVQKWQNAQNGETFGYKFSYDGQNRLTSAVYGEGSDLRTNANRYDETVSEYDQNGNIKHFTRRGLSRALGSKKEYGVIDDLSINLNGNQITDITDKSSKSMYFYQGAMDFDGGSGQTKVRKYNGNGAMTQDEARGIALIEYDEWNNPNRIQFTNGNVTKYVYTATGQKLRTVHYIANTLIEVPLGEKRILTQNDNISKDSTDYHGGFIMENGKPLMYQFAGGYVSLKNAQSNQPEIAFYYYDQDHLGNNRIVVNETTGAAEQVTNYYPFGTPIVDKDENGSFQKFKYNGKELDMMSGLNSYDY